MLNGFKKVLEKIGFSSEKLKSDRTFNITIVVLVIFGLIMLASASSITAYNTYHKTYYFFFRQLGWVFFGAIAFYFFSKFDYKKIRPFAGLFLILSIIFLCLVFIPGLTQERNLSKSWINIFGFSMQPAEFVKLTLILYLAALFEKTEETPKRFLSFIVIFFILALLMILQPDFGTLVILSIISFTLYFVGGGKLKHIIITLIIGLLAFSVYSRLPGRGHLKDRISCYLNPSYDTQFACYQLNQSLIAIGSGGIFGRGLGESRQKFLYLPEVQNDFIFAIIAEETGWIVCSLVILGYGLIFYRGWVVSHRTKDAYGRNLVIGVMVWVTGQAIINLGGITNLLPMTGVPLPLISYGGSAILSTLAGLGIVASVSRHSS